MILQLCYLSSLVFAKSNSTPLAVTPKVEESCASGNDVQQQLKLLKEYIQRLNKRLRCIHVR